MKTKLSNSNYEIFDYKNLMTRQKHKNIKSIAKQSKSNQSNNKTEQTKHKEYDFIKINIHNFIML